MLWTVSLCWLGTARYIPTGAMAGIGPFGIFIDAAGTPAFGMVVYHIIRDSRRK